MKAVCRGQFQRYQIGGGQTANIQSQKSDPRTSDAIRIRRNRDRLGAEGCPGPGTTEGGFIRKAPGPDGTGRRDIVNPIAYLATEMVVVRLMAKNQ